MRTSVKVTIILFIVGLVFSLLGAGWSQRPIIDYYMDGLDDSFTFHGYPITINLKHQNRGNIDASLKLVVTVTDANLTVDSLESWIEHNETQIKFNVAAPSHMESYSSHSVKVYPVGSPQNFTITYTIEDTTGGLINSIVSRLFLESHGYYPTYAVYNRTNTDTYERLK